MSWISWPAENDYPAILSSGVVVSPVIEPAGVADRRAGTGYDWSDADRAEMLAIAGAVETAAKPADWRDGLSGE